MNEPKRAYAFEALFRTGHALSAELFSQKQPLHFHPSQDEYIRVVAGKLVVEVDGRDHVLSADDDEFRVRAWANHRLYPLYPLVQDEATETRVLIWGQKVDQTFHEDILFLENLYHYQNDIVMNKKKVDLVQILCVSYYISLSFEYGD